MGSLGNERSLVEPEPFDDRMPSRFDRQGVSEFRSDVVLGRRKMREAVGKTGGEKRLSSVVAVLDIIPRLFRSPREHVE